MEINIQEWDNIQPDPISKKTRIELALIDLYNTLKMPVPIDHQTILNDLAQKLLSREASLTVKQVDSSLESSVSEAQAQLRVQANSPYNDGWTREYYEKELKRYNAGARDWPAQKSEESVDADFMYNWIRNKSGKAVKKQDLLEENWMELEYYDEYIKLKESGMFYEFYPQFTGDWQKDKYAFCHERKYGNR